MNKPCPNCYGDLKRYGFTLEVDGVYMTMVKEIKTCCAVKVKVTKFNTTEVTFIAEDNDKTYTKSRKDFMTSSWRLKGPHDTLFNEGE